MDLILLRILQKEFAFDFYIKFVKEEIPLPIKFNKSVNFQAISVNTNEYL